MNCIPAEDVESVVLPTPKTIKMPIVGLGTWQIGGDDLETSLEAALDAGYRLIDTASIYQNEEVIGKVIKRWIKLGKITRDEVFITTKLPPTGMTPEGVRLYLKSSLKNLQTDYIDLFLIHVPFGFRYRAGNMLPLTNKGVVDLNMNVNHVAIWKEMEKMLDKNLTKAIGLSNFNVRQIRQILSKARIAPVNLQVELHIYNQQNDLVNFCNKNNITVTSYSTFASPGSKAFFDSLGLNTFIPDLFSNPVVKKIADKHGKMPGQVLLRHMVQKGISVLPKSVNPERVRQNIDIFDFELDKNDMNDLNGLNVNPPVRVVDMTMFPGVKKHPEYPW